MDIHKFDLQLEMFIELDSEIDRLSYGAKILLEIYDRLLLTNEDKDINRQG